MRIRVRVRERIYKRLRRKGMICPSEYTVPKKAFLSEQ